MSTRPGGSGKRSRNGCLTCRARKVKCDERPDGCLNCERLDIVCQPASGAVAVAVSSSNRSASPPNKTIIVATPEGATPDSQHRRYRTFQSCRSCRSAKARCSGEEPACQRCIRRREKCTYDSRAAPQWIARASEPKGDQKRKPSGSNGSGSRKRGRSEDSEPQRGDAGRQLSQDRAGAPGARNSQSDGRQPVEAPRSRARSDDLDIKDHWLFAPCLPAYNLILDLVEEYFRTIHPLRCFGFIHKPSFLQKVEDEIETRRDDDAGHDEIEIRRDDNILLLAVCALGAKFYATKLPEFRTKSQLSLHAGSQWSQRALSLIFASLRNATEDLAMAAVLLHEHELRVGNHATAFMVTGLAVRLGQTLQLNVEDAGTGRPTPLEEPNSGQISRRESRRRLGWAIYAMDAWVGSGVDELTLVKEHDMKIHLPCNERDFILETIPNAGRARWLIEPRGVGTGKKFDDLDVAAHFIRLVSIRRRVLKYVKHLDAGKPPWLADSEFTLLQADFKDWHDALPASLQFTRPAIQQRKVSHQHGALLFLHLTFHQSLCDLTRIGMRDLFRIRSPITFPPEQGAFLQQVQDACFDNCLAVSNVFYHALKHGSEALADTWLPVVAHDVTRVIVHYMEKKLGSIHRHSSASWRRKVTDALKHNLEALRKMDQLITLARPLYLASATMVMKAGFNITTPVDMEDETGEQVPSPRAQSPSVLTPEHLLNPLAIYRMARRDIRENEHNAARSSNASVVSPDSYTTGPRPGTRANITAQIQAHVPAHHAPVTPLSTDHHPPPPHPVFDETAPADWPNLDYLQFPSSFDDLQMYMQLPDMLDDLTYSLRNGEIDLSAYAIEGPVEEGPNGQHMVVHGSGMPGNGMHMMNEYGHPPMDPNMR